MFNTIFNGTGFININHITCNSNDENIPDAGIEYEFYRYS